MRQPPKVSVITVCRNASAFIEDTVESVLEQTYPNIEYIVIDGKSTDGTYETLQKFQARIDHLVHEPDTGLYHAMNKGLRRATGDFVCFINAGDQFRDAQTLESIELLLHQYDLIYGDALIIDKSGNELGLKSELSTHKLPDSLQLSSFYLGQPFSHQSALIRLSLCRDYDTRYRIGADYDWLIHVMWQNPKAARSELPLSRFRVGGVSSDLWYRSLRERIVIQTKHFGLARAALNHCRILIRGIAHLVAGKKLK